MTLFSTVYLAAEDLPGLAIGRLLIARTKTLKVYREENANGFGTLRNKSANFHNMATRGFPVLIIADLDMNPCPSGLQRKWLGCSPHEHFLFRIAVREIESWLLADREGIAELLKINPQSIPANPEALDDPKAELLNLAKKSSRKIQEALLPPRGSKARIGPEYNSTITDYVNTRWNMQAAATRAPSLKRAIAAVEGLAEKVELLKKH